MRRAAEPAHRAASVSARLAGHSPSVSPKLCMNPHAATRSRASCSARASTFPTSLSINQSVSQSVSHFRQSSVTQPDNSCLSRLPLTPQLPPPDNQSAADVRPGTAGVCAAGHLDGELRGEGALQTH